ncbi:type II toxin-antitoxin system Phd/YefM family antitoxin [Enterococcus nangangensis]|uniref:type II toxin-antitoxin system Phd/YefM family antitoxin n=1 Tax=Enterococcus nangangensis TaxID=2559926 RepID=UPI0027D96F78|nr:type II toxin-antitoxin system Phd/YefM family antitoxin [Enterococcus nangangensis]
MNDGEPVYLTKNGYGSMVVLSLEAYSQLTNPVDSFLDEADRLSEKDKTRLSHEEVFDNLRKKSK